MAAAIESKVTQLLVIIVFLHTIVTGNVFAHLQPKEIHADAA